MKSEWNFLGRVAGTFVVVLVVVSVVVPFCLKRTICRVDTATSQVANLALASHGYYVECHRWPSSISDLTNSSNGGPFLKVSSRGLLDPWGTQFTYMPYSISNGFGLAISWGADAEPGGEGMDRDRVARFGDGK